MRSFLTGFVLMFIYEQAHSRDTFYKRVSIKNPLSQLSEYKCFDSRIPNFGKIEVKKIRGGFEEKKLIGEVADSNCEAFKKVYEIGIMNYKEPALACFEFDESKRYHKKIVRLINSTNLDPLPCTEKLSYLPRMISQECGNHSNCMIALCHVDVFNESGKLLITRLVYSGDVLSVQCPRLKMGQLVTKSGKCINYDLETNGKNHFLSEKCDSAIPAKMTKYSLERPQDDIFGFLGSFVSGKTCHEIDEDGGNLYFTKVDEDLCDLNNVSDSGINKDSDHGSERKEMIPKRTTEQ